MILTDINYTVDISCNGGDVRLVGGANDLEGRVKICYKDKRISMSQFLAE